MSDEKKTRRRRIFLSNSDEQQEVSKPFKRGLGMKITIHRGTDQIGGSVTEYEHEGFDHMTNTEVAPRIYRFPYHKL